MSATLVISVLLAAPPEAVRRGFEQYAAAQEARMVAEIANGGFFSATGLDRLRKGETLLDSVPAPEIDGGLIHHRKARIFAPGARFAQALALVEDYDRYPAVYRPDIQRARVLERQGHDARIYLQIFKRKILSATLDTEHEIRYTGLDDQRGYSFTRTTKVEEAGRADRGFLWRINSYWRFWEHDGGVYIQVESISLSRDAPAGLGWLVTGFIKSVHRDFLVHMAESTRDALRVPPR